MRSIVLSLSIAFVVWSPAVHEAAAELWRPAGFGGAGNFLSVHFDPSHPGVVYAASDVAGVFRSMDHGNTWELRSRGLANVEVSSFAVDPFDPATLYAGVGAFGESSRSGIYVSHDSGLTWQHLPDSYAKGITFRKYRTADAIAPDPGHQGVILSGSRDNGIWRSTDGGSSWTQVYDAPLTSAPLFNDGTIDDDPETASYSAPVSIVVFDPADPTIAYAGLYGFGVVRSTTGGVAGSWQLVNSGLPNEAMVKSVAIGGNDVLYAALATDGVYKTTNGGSSWQPANGGLPTLDEDAWVSSVAVDPSDPGKAYLTLATYDYANVWKTANGGATWAPRGDVSYDPVNDPTEMWAGDPTMSWYLTIDPHNHERIFYTGYWDIIRSDDGGEHWVTRIVGAQNTCVTDLAVDSQVPHALYATHMDAGLLSSADNGATWTMLLPPPGQYDPDLAGHYWRIVIAGAGNAKHYYTTCDPWERDCGKVLRSTDGAIWTTVHTQTRPAGSPDALMAGCMLGLAADPGNPSTLYFTQDGGQVFKSTDNGNTWSPTPGQPGYDAFTYALTVDENGQVFAGTHGGGLWRSGDGGSSWERVLQGQDWIYHAVASQGAVYATTDDANLHCSTDGGDTWHELTDFDLEDYGDGVGAHGMAISVDPDDPEHILFSRMDTWHPADAGAGVVESTDGGQTWSELNEGLRRLNVSALAATADGGLFLGTWGGGIWRHGDVGVLDDPGRTSMALRLLRISPNPSAGRTTLRFEADQRTPVKIGIHDLLGRTVAVLRKGCVPPGLHRVAWDASGLPPGTYVVRLEAGASVASERLVLRR